MNQVTVRKITNGYLVSTIGTAPPPASTWGSNDTYCIDLSSVQAFLLAHFEPDTTPAQE